MFDLPTEYSFYILYIISQVFASVSFVFDVLAVQQKKESYASKLRYYGGILFFFT